MSVMVPYDRELVSGSIQTQIVGYMNPIAARFVPVLGTPEVTYAIAEHIAEFSLAGMRAIAQKQVELKQEVKP